MVMQNNMVMIVNELNNIIKNCVIEDKQLYNKEILKRITNRNLDLELHDKSQKNLLHYASYGGYIDVLEWLIENTNLDIESIDENKNTVLHTAVENLQIKSVQFLVEYFIKYNLNIDAQYSHGKTLLHYAVSKGNRALVELLVKNGIDINIQDYDKKTALHYAVEENNLELVKYLICKDADIHALDINLESIFHYAAKNNNEAVMKYLAAQGLDINAMNNNNKNALDLINIVDVPIFKTLLLLGVIINKDIHCFSDSKDHKELAKIANIAYFIYKKKI